METPPDDLDTGDLVAALEDGWGIAPAAVEHAPVGFGSHHWTCVDTDGRRWFLTVDDLDGASFLGSDRTSTLAGLRTAFSVARSLRRSCALEFVVAPVAARDADVVRVIDGRYALAVLPYVEGRAQRFDHERDRAERATVLAMLARLHSSTTDVAPRTVDAVPSRHAVLDALEQLSRPWSAGPFSELARAWLAAHESAALGAVDALTAYGTAAAPYVLTHGEPHPGNVMVTASGPALVDWDTVGLAPPERDLWHVVVDDADVALYEDLAGRRVDPSGLRMQALAWDVGELGAYLSVLRRPHVRDADTEVAWATLSTLDLTVAR